MSEKIYNGRHIQWKSRIRVLEDDKIIERINSNGDPVDSGIIIGRVTTAGCDNQYLVTWPKYTTTEVVNVPKSRNTDAWVYPLCHLKFDLHGSPATSTAIVIRSKNLLFYKTPKNACSTLVATAKREDQGLKHSNPINVPWSETMDAENNAQIINYKEYVSAKYIPYKKILIHHDPIVRFANYSNYVFTKRIITLEPYIGFIEDEDKNDQEVKKAHIETMINLLECMMSPHNNSAKDEHMQPQNEIHRYIGEVDVMVDVRDLTKYMREELGIEPEMANVDVKTCITADDFTEEQKKKLAEIYALDYSWFAQYESVAYRP